MKKQTLLAIAALMIFGLGAGTLAYQQTNGTAKTAMSCCCCKGDSCPMKAKGEKAQTVGADMKNVIVVSSDEGCCGSCCKGEKEKKDAPAL